MFDKIHARRLTALADHLETAEKLKVGQFDFNITVGTAYDKNGHVCGSAGCALGEASLLWKDEFRIGEGLTSHYFDTAGEFFGLDEYELIHLFSPYEQQQNRFGGKHLTRFATRYEVAANIREFLAIKGKEVI